MVHVTTRSTAPTPPSSSDLAAFSAATIHEAQGRKGALDSAIKPIDRDMSFCGTAFTVVCHPARQHHAAGRHQLRAAR